MTRDGKLLGRTYRDGLIILSHLTKQTLKYTYLLNNKIQDIYQFIFYH